MKEPGKTASSRAFTGKHETAALTAQQAAVELQLRKEEQVKKKNQKRTLYIIFTALAAATIIVAAFILKGAAEQRSYNTYYSSALQDYYNGAYDSALASLRRASAITETEECTMLMVDCYEKQGNYKKALQLLEEMYKKDKSNAVVSARIAEIKEKESDEKNESMITIVGKSYEEGTTSLSLQNNALGDGLLTDVIKLYSLSTLTLSGDNLSNISPLSTLGGLVYLDLSDNMISDLYPLSNLHELKTLYLDNNPVTDFSPLYSLTQLDMLSIRGIGITEEQLKGLSSALPNCAIHCETAQEKVSEITLGGATFKTDAIELNLSNMGISDISALSACRDLTRLDITGNSVADLTPLMDLPNLEWLSIKDNMVVDLRPLMGLSRLRYLNAEGNGITGTAALSSMSNLNELYQHSELYYSIEIGGESFKENITELSLFGRGITDITPINRFKRLEKLDLGSNEIENVNMFQYTSAPLRELKLGNNRITDPTALMYLGSLERLDVSGNNIGIVSPFKLMTSLKWLNLSNNPLGESDVEELRAALPDCEIIFDS